jgi:hypothetical protein
MKFPGIGVPNRRHGVDPIKPLHQRRAHFIFRSAEAPLYTGPVDTEPTPQDIAQTVVGQSVETTLLATEQEYRSD